MKLNKRWIFVLLGVILIVVIGSLVTNNGGINVDTTSVEKAPMEVSIRADGFTRVVHQFMVTAPISGDLQRLTLREGDTVTEGQVLARILSASGSEQSKRVAEASLEAARARLVQVELTLKDVVELAMQARIEAGRRESLAEQDIITLEMLEQARLAAQSAFRQQAVAEAALVAARAEVRAAEAMLLSYDSMDRDGAAFEMVSPVNGHVLRLMDENARTVMAGTPLLEVGDTQDIELVVDVLSEDAVQIAVGNLVHITGWGGPSVLSGSVRLVEPYAYTKIYGALGRLLMIAEAYPDLKANENMLSLQEELTSTENKVAYARQGYNDSVTSYNTAREVFPAVMVAGMLGFNEAELLEIENPEERVAPKVSF